MMRNLLFLSLLMITIGCNEPKQADLIIHNATIYTVDDAFSSAEAVAVKDGKIIAVGAEHEILNAYTASEIIDARHGFVYPGFIDAHSHILGYAIEKQRLDLVGTKSFDEVVSRIKAYTESVESKWVMGRGWDQNDWEEQTFPTNDTLQHLFPDHFIALKRIDGHAYLVSNNVLELAQISQETRVDGGKI